MTCDEVHDLLPGFAFDALEAEERDAVATHLATCRAHDAELVDLRATTMALSVLDEAGASPRLRDRVLAVAGAPARLDDHAPGEAAGDTRAPARVGAGSSVTRGASRWRAAGIAAAIALVMFGAGWVAGARSQPEQPARFAYEMRSPDGQLVQFAGVEGSDLVTVTMDGLEAAPEGRQYQVWAIRDEGWISLGACNTNARGWWRGDFRFRLRPGEEVALTVEPTGGSPRPTSAAILRTKL